MDEIIKEYGTTIIAGVSVILLFGILACVTVQYLPEVITRFSAGLCG